MSPKKLGRVYGITFVAISVPFTVIHLIAKPDDAPITPLQHAVAALANYFGPWGVAFVRLVDFPNAGLRSFSWGLAIGLTLLGALLVALARQRARLFVQLLLAALWAGFTLVWFVVGMTQIADGLL